MSRKMRPFGTFAGSDSDSDDTDYHPGDCSDPEEDQLSKNKKKRAKKGIAKGSGSRKVLRTSRGDCKQQIANGSHILQRFPPEILVKVFQYGAVQEGVVKFIPRVSQVCRGWYEVSKNPLVWSVLYLPSSTLKLTPAKLTGLLQNDLSCCKSLNLSGQDKLQENNTLTILKAMPGLRSLNLSDCYHLKTTLLRKLPSLVPHLRRLNICFTAAFATSINLGGIEHFLAECGKNLVELRLARILCIQLSPKQIFTAIEENCPKLEILDVSIPDPNKTTAYPSKRYELAADRFFSKCPKITELYLDGFNLVTPRNFAPGTEMLQLKCLHNLSIGYHSHEHTERPLFYRMFGSTPSLQYLDISKSRLMPSLITTQVKHVTELVMKDMKWRDADHASLFECMEAWKHSLVHLDLSFNLLVDNSLDAALLVYGSRRDKYPLQSLDVKYSNVTTTSIQSVLQNCSKLLEIDLTSCRELPRGCKHFIHKKEFPFLEKCLQRG